MKDLVLWWIGDGASLLVRYILLAAVWLVGILINTKKQSFAGWMLLCLWGAVALAAAVGPVWMAFADKNPYVGMEAFTGLAYAIYALEGFFAGMVYIVLMVHTIVYTCLWKNSRTDIA